jgi:hypothetical protein
VREVATADPERAAVVAVYSDNRAWKGAPCISASARARIDAATAARADAVIVLFGHPRLALSLPGRFMLGAWGGEAVMQSAAAEWLSSAGART